MMRSDYDDKISSQSLCKLYHTYFKKFFFEKRDSFIWDLRSSDISIKIEITRNFLLKSIARLDAPFKMDKWLVSSLSQFLSDITRWRIVLDVVPGLRNNSVFKYYSLHIAPRVRGEPWKATSRGRDFHWQSRVFSAWLSRLKLAICNWNCIAFTKSTKGRQTIEYKARKKQR